MKQMDFYRLRIGSTLWHTPTIDGKRKCFKVKVNTLTLEPTKRVLTEAHVDNVNGGVTFKKYEVDIFPKSTRKVVLQYYLFDRPSYKSIHIWDEIHDQMHRKNPIKKKSWFASLFN